MNNYISNLNIKSFRGIANLQIDNIGPINVVVGENNTGKTSVLEAIQLFCSPNEYEVIRISKQRDKYRMPSRMSLNTLNSLLFLFDVNSAYSKIPHEIEISGTIAHKAGTLRIKGEVVQEILDLSTLAESNPTIRRKMRDKDLDIEEEVPTFIGTIEHSMSPSTQHKIVDLPIKIDIEVNEYSRFIGRTNSDSLISVEMVSTVDHILQNAFSELIKNKEVKNVATEMLKKFDSTIEDIRYINEDDRFVPVIENNNEKYIPLSSYGDGMKKALSVLNAIVSAKGGIVLIDEFETALHTSVMKSVFKFMIEVAKEMEVQLFLTTHSIEAVDKLLEASQQHLKETRIIRLKKAEEGMFAKVTTGDIALENRQEYNMELRI